MVSSNRPEMVLDKEVIAVFADVNAFEFIVAGLAQPLQNRQGGLL